MCSNDVYLIRDRLIFTLSKHLHDSLLELSKLKDKCMIGRDGSWICSFGVSRMPFDAFKTKKNM
jgi:hypothetical protein